MARIYRFDNFLLDTANWTLYRGEAVVKLQPKQLDVLIYLVEHAGCDVTREELMEKLWPGVVIEPSGLVRNISHIRKALGDEVPYRYIESMQGGAYRFIAADLHAEEPSSATAPAHHTQAKQSSRVSRLVTGYGSIALGAVLIVLWVTLSIHVPREAASFTSVRITSNSSGLPITAAAISPDGNKLAFVEGGKLFLSDVKTVERHEISVPENIILNSIEWFPNGMHLLAIGYNWRERQLSAWNIAILSGKADLLISDAMLAACSPDGSTIAFARRNELWLANVDGSMSRLVTRLPDGSTFGARIQFVDSGKAVVIGRYKDGMITNIELYPLDHPVATTLFEGQRSMQGFQIVDGNQLIVSQLISALKYETEMISMRVDLKTGTHPEPTVIGKWDGYVSTWLSADRSGKKLLFVNYRADSTIYVASLLRGNSVLSDLRRLTYVRGSNRPAGWMPDSSAVLFISDRLGRFGIYTQSLASEQITTLVADMHFNSWPAITSDGKWLYYFSFDMSGSEIPETYRFMRKPLAGGEAQQVDTQSGLIRGLRCAVTVNLCIHAKQGDDEIVYFKVDPQSGKLKEFSHDQMVPIAEFFRWDISPDGRYLAHIDQTGQSNDIRIMSINNPGDIRVMHLPQLELLRSLRWDAQSRGFFVSTHNDNGDMLILYHIGLDGTISTLRQEPGGVQGWVIPSPDGKRLAIQSWLFDGNIWMLKRD